MDRRLLTLACAAILTLLPLRRLPAAAQVAAGRPNILVIIADDLGWHDVGFHGSKLHTPNLDALAAGGMQLNRFYVLPVCTPTRAALMTGRYPMRQGLQRGVINPWDTYGLPLEERTLAQALQDAGYETAITGKWHLGLVAKSYLPLQRGFEHQYGFYNGLIDYRTHRLYGGLDWHRDEEALRETGYSTNLIAAEAVRRIEDRDTSRPLFLYLAFNAPHSPLERLRPFVRSYPRNWSQARRTYASMVTGMDAGIGEVLSALRRQGMDRNTLIVFLSDNGGNLAEGGDNRPLRAGKRSLYDGGVRVPAVAYWPGHVPAGSVTNANLHVVDLFPTLVAQAGGSGSQPLALDGRDAGTVFFDAAGGVREEMLINVEPEQGAIIRDNWKLIVFGALSGNTMPAIRPAYLELYDLVADPGEHTNLARAHPEVVQELLRRLEPYVREAQPPKGARIEQPPAGMHVPRVWGDFPDAR